MPELGRIFFHGNPWPDGHPLKEFRWTGLLKRDGSLFFRFHLKSQDYDAEVTSHDPDEGASDWSQPIVWNNYHACTLSADKWHEGGFKAGDAATPFAPAIGKENIFIVDPLEEDGAPDWEERAFAIYLLGHDGVMDHRIAFTLQDANGNYALRWTGKIALEYAGGREFKYSFAAELPKVALSRIAVEEGIAAHDAGALLVACYRGPALVLGQDDKDRPVFRPAP